jgi:hypothetical protein
MKYLPLPSQEKLNSLFTYSVVTGELRRINQSKTGTKHHTGYTHIRVDGTIYLAHRLIWRLVTGEDPGPLQVDHKDHDRTNNSWHNLRLATNSQNQCNRPKPALNSSGYKGVSYCKHTQKYLCQTIKDGFKMASYHETAELAHAAYCKAAAELHGEYARTQ